jgi:hypothetical protein
LLELFKLPPASRPSGLARALEDYLAFFKSGLSNHEKMDEVDLELNMCLKSALLEILYRHVFLEGSQGLAGSQ